MASDVFVDTSAWYALVDRRDALHRKHADHGYSFTDCTIEALLA